MSLPGAEGGHLATTGEWAPSTTDPQQVGSARLQGLGLILLVALAQPLVRTLERWVSPEPPYDPVSYDPVLWGLYEIFTSLGLLFLVAYVLFRQGRSLHDLGVTARWSDIPAGLALTGLAVLPYAIRDFAGRREMAGSALAGFTAERTSLIILVAWIFAVIKFQLVLRAYLMTELLALTGSVVLAVVASIVVREPYTWPVVTGGLFFSVYYWKTRRATPLVMGGVGVALIRFLV